MVDEKNVDNLFTEFFSVIVKNIYASDMVALDYTFKEHKQIIMQTDKAIIGLLHGLQYVSKIAVSNTLADKAEILHLARFMLLMTNLIEALHVVRSDFEYSIGLNQNN